MIAVLFSAIVGAVANRFSGWTNQTWIPGRHIYWAALGLFLISWVFVGLGWATAIALSALTYRIPGWYGSIDMGRDKDSLVRDARVMFYNTLRIAPVFAYAMIFHGVWLAPLLLVVGAAGAVAAYIFGNYVGYKLVDDPFRYIEPAVGAVLGAMVGLLLVL